IKSVTVENTLWIRQRPGSDTYGRYVYLVAIVTLDWGSVQVINVFDDMAHANCVKSRTYVTNSRT
ncbi:hypothetical protein MAR_032023, partial [Mya arenaria]